MPSRTRLRRIVSRNTTQRRVRHRSRDLQFAERAVQPRHMAALIDQAPAPHLADFIDAVGELIAAVLDGDLGVVARQIAAVDVCDAGHGDRLI